MCSRLIKVAALAGFLMDVFRSVLLNYFRFNATLKTNEAFD